MSKKNEQATEQTKTPIPPSSEPSHGVAPMWTDWPEDWPEGVEPDDSEETDESDESTDDAE